MGRISGELRNVFGAGTAKALEEMIENAAKPKSGTIAAAVGVVMLMMGATGVFGQLKDALNTIWNVEPKNDQGVKGFIKNRFLSLAMVLGSGFLLLVTLVFDAAISAMGDYVSGRVPGGEALLQAIQLAVSFGLVTVVFAMIFQYLPDLAIAWRDVWLGAGFTAVFFVLGKFGLGLYLGKAAVGSAYGAAGSLVILLVWVYWSAQILFFGAEFTQVYARTYGSLKGDRSKIEARARARKLEDHPTAAPTAPPPAFTKSGGGNGKLAAGGILGLIAGTFLGGITVTLVAVKSVRKLIAMPFR
jgi:membrane protein